MKVTSPIGEMPFTPKRTRISRRGITIEGAMGAWPARVTVGAADLPGILRVAALPLIILVALVAAIVIAITAII